MVNTELIRISKQTKDLLDKIKITQSETYEEVLIRLLKEKSKWI